MIFNGKYVCSVILGGISSVLCDGLWNKPDVGSKNWAHGCFFFVTAKNRLKLCYYQNNAHYKEPHNRA